MLMTNKEKSAAILTIKEAADMTPDGKKEIARWLRRQAKFLEQYGGEYATRFTARYLYLEDA